jgi:Polyketide cyclase / dehydrase and lipid transport
MPLITFACQTTLPFPPAAIAAQILDLANWPSFAGYGPLPGIKSAVYEIQTPDILGSRIRVTNRDGSSHVEEITAWQPARRLQLRFTDFSAPVSHLASCFLETWEFEPRAQETQVTRSFELHPRSLLTWPPLWLISFLLKAAINRHLHDLRRP